MNRINYYARAQYSNRKGTFFLLTLSLLLLVPAPGTATAQDLYATVYDEAYGGEEYVDLYPYAESPLVSPAEEGGGDTCFETPLDCESLGVTETFCGEEYLCDAVGTVAADANEPDFRQCIDECLAEGIRKQQQCNADYRNDLAWCDREYRAGTWRHDVCYYLAGQTRNLCKAAEAATTAACVAGCLEPLTTPLKGIWKKLAK